MTDKLPTYTIFYIDTLGKEQFILIKNALCGMTAQKFMQNFPDCKRIVRTVRNSPMLDIDTGEILLEGEQ